MLYQLNLQGATYSGSTNFPGSQTSYVPIENFVFGNALLAVDAPLWASNSTPEAGGNGANIVDVGLYVGSMADPVVQGGEMMWASNSALHHVYNGITGASSMQEAAIDETYQSWDPTTRTLTMDIDPAMAPITQIDHFVKSPGLLGMPAEITGGQVVLQFSEDFSTVSGSAVFFGSGYIEPGTSAWYAEFSGSVLSESALIA